MIEEPPLLLIERDQKQNSVIDLFLSYRGITLPQWPMGRSSV